MATRVPLKLKDSADFQEFSSTEENYLAYQVGQYLISGDSSDVGSLTMDSSGGTQAISGTFTDTAYDSAVGTGGSPGSFLTFSQTNTTLRTNLGTLTPADSDYRIPVFRMDSDSQQLIKEYNDSDMNVLIDRLNGRIATSDYLGSYRLGSSAPSGDYSVNLANVMTDTRTDGSSTAYNIYQRTTQSAPTQVLPFAIKRSNGDSGDYQGLQLMTDRQIQQGLGLRARNRLGTTGDSAGTFIGNYKLLSSAAGTPTDLGFSGTWAARGTATDTRQAIVDANYSRNRASTYSRLRESTFSDNYSRTRSSNYSDDYSRVRSSAYIDTYTVNRESNYSVGFVGDYSRNFTRLRSSNFTRTRQSTFNYTRNRASTFTGDYLRVLSYLGNFTGNFVGSGTYTTPTVLTQHSVNLAQYETTSPGNGNFSGWDTVATFTNVPSNQTITTGTVRGNAYQDRGSGTWSGMLYLRAVTPSGTLLQQASVSVSNTYQSFLRSPGSLRDIGGFSFTNPAGNSTIIWEAGCTTNHGHSSCIEVFTMTVADGVDYTRNFVSNYTGILSYSRNRASTFTGNYSRTLDYLGNYSRNFLGEYARDFTRTTPDTFTRDFTGNYSREFSRTRSSAYTRASQSSFAGNYTGNFQGNYTGNFIGDFVGPRVLTAQGSTDTTIYSNTLQVLGTETHTFNTDGTFSSTSFTTPTTTAPEGTKAIIVTGGIGTNASRYTKFSGCVFNLGFPNDVTLTEVASAADPDTEYTFDSVIYGGNIGDNLNSSRQFSLTVSFTNQARMYGAGIRVLFLNKDFKSGTLSSGTDRTWVSQTNITSTVGYYTGSTPFTLYDNGISVYTATIYDAPNHSAAIGVYISGAVFTSGYNNASLTHGGDRDSIHGYKLHTGNNINITPGARRFRQDFGETLLAATFQEDAFVDNTQDYLRASTRSSLVTSTRTSTRTGTSRDASGEFATSYTGNFAGNFTGDYTRFANTTNEGDSYGGSLNWSAFDENGDSILTLDGGTTLSANTHSYLSFDGNSMSISFDFNSFAVREYPTKSNSYASQLSVKTNTYNVIPPDTEITFYWADTLGPSTKYKWMRIVVPEDYNVGRPSQTGSGTASNGGPTLLYHTFTVEDGLEFGIGQEGSESSSNSPLTFTATPGSASGLLRVRANETSYTRDSTRTSTRTSMTFTGNYSRNFEGNYSRNYTRTRTSTYLGSDTFSRTFTGNYVGNYSRDFTRTFEGNYSRNFVGNYQGNYANNYLGDYSRTFIGNYAGNSIGSGSTNIETYTLYVRTS